MTESTDQTSDAIHVALCEDDKCPWKYRGVTAEATERAAVEHAEGSIHSVSIYEGERRVGRTGKLDRAGLE